MSPLRLLIVALAAVSLGGCFPSPKPELMVPADVAQRPPADPSLRQAISIGEVRRSKQPTWKHEVNEEQFRQALSLSLQQAGLLAPGQGRYTLSARLLSMEMPVVVIDAAIRTKALYILTAPGQQWDFPVESVGKASFSDGLDANMRLKVANENGIRENIRDLINQLLSFRGGAPAPAPQPYAPQPYAPQPYAPQPYAPQPYAPQPYAPQPYTPPPYTPPPAPSNPSDVVS